MKPLIKLRATVPTRITEKSKALSPESVLGFTPGKYRFFLAKIVNPGQTIQKFIEDQDVILYLPVNADIKIEGKTLLEIEESLLVPIPDKTNRNEALVAGSVALKLLNSLFQKGKYREGETVMIVGLTYQYAYILLQLILSINGTVFLVMNTAEEFDRIRTFLETMNLTKTSLTLVLRSDQYQSLFMEKTSGLGMDIILDYLDNHSNKEMRDFINLLAPNGRWVVSDINLQLNPPETLSLLMRNASLGFSWEEIYGAFKFEIGKALNIIEEMMNYVAKGKVKIMLDGEFKGIEEWEKASMFNEKKMIGSVVINLLEKT